MTRRRAVLLCMLLGALTPALGYVAPTWVACLVTSVGSGVFAHLMWLRYDDRVRLALRVLDAITHLKGVILWTVEADGSIAQSVGGGLRTAWPELAPDGVMRTRLHLDDWPGHPNRDQGLDVARKRGDAAWAGDAGGAEWLSVAASHDRSDPGGPVTVLTVDASAVAQSTRSRIVRDALGES